MNTSHSKPVELAAKKPYIKPEVVYKQPLEAMAAACTPIPPGKADTGAPNFCGSGNLFS